MTVERNPVSTANDGEPRFSIWTGKVRGWALRRLPPDKLLPEGQPSFVSSWIYVFGMGAVAAFVYILGSGAILRPSALPRGAGGFTQWLR